MQDIEDVEYHEISEKTENKTKETEISDISDIDDNSKEKISVEIDDSENVNKGIFSQKKSKEESETFEEKEEKFNEDNSNEDYKESEQQDKTYSPLDDDIGESPEEQLSEEDIQTISEVFIEIMDWGIASGCAAISGKKSDDYEKSKKQKEKLTFLFAKVLRKLNWKVDTISIFVIVMLMVYGESLIEAINDRKKNKK